MTDQARRRRRPRRLAGWLLCLLFAALLGPGEALGDDVLAKVRRQGAVRCGVSDLIPGLAAQDRQGQWSGMEVDFCRALAAAIFDDPARSRVVPLSAAARFPALLAGRVDLIAGGTTWTLARELGLKVAFVGPVMFSSQRLVVHADSGIEHLAQLNGKPICVARATTHLDHLQDYFAARALTLELRVGNSYAQAREDFLAGRCMALTADEVALASLHPDQATASRVHFLPELVSNEPLSMVVPDKQTDWERIVRWVLFALIAAEADAADPATVATPGAGTAPDASAAIARRIGPAMGLDPAWAERAVSAVGHYGDIYERNLGAASKIGLSRGVNRPWGEGGMLYSPPLH